MDDRFIILGEEVILTLLSQSGASESAAVCFVISLSICLSISLRVTSQHISYLNRSVCVRVCACVCVRVCV